MKLLSEAGIARLRSFPWRFFLAAFVVRFALFLGVLFFIGSTGFEWGDSKQYLGLARSLLDGNGFSLDGAPFFFRTIGYPLFLAGGLAVFRSTTGFVFFQLLLASFLPLLILHLGEELGFEKRTSRIAAWISVFEPHIVYFSLIILTESLYTLVLLLGILFVFRAIRTSRIRESVKSGIAFGVGILIKPMLQFFPIVGFGLLLPWIRQIKWRETLKHTVIILALTGAVLSPWMCRNYRMFGSFTLSNQGSAAALFYLGTSIVSVRDQLSYPDAEAKVGAEFKEKHGSFTSKSAENIAYGREAFGYIRAYPLIFARLIAINTFTLWTSANYNMFLHYWKITPPIDHSVLPPTHYLAQGRIGDLLTESWKIFSQPFYIVGILGRIVWLPITLLFLYGGVMAYRRLPEKRFQILFIGALCAYWTMTIWVDGLGIEARLRYPLMPIEFLFAAYGYDTLRAAYDERRQKAR